VTASIYCIDPKAVYKSEGAVSKGRAERIVKADNTSLAAVNMQGNHYKGDRSTFPLDARESQLGRGKATQTELYEMRYQHSRLG
jgi:hypothetical protein